MIIRKSPARDRADGRGRRARRRHARARRRARSARASRRPSSTGSPRSSSATTAASRPRRATGATRRRSASRRTTMVVHGIPGDVRVQEGDLVSVDVGVTLDGFVADSAYTFGGGRDRRPRPQRLLEVARRRSRRGSSRRGVGNRVGDIWPRRSRRWSRGAGFSVVRSLVGHGVGRRLPRGSADPELRRARPRAAALGGDDARDRADDHGRRPGCVMSTADEWSISTADGSLVGPLRAHRRRHRGRPADPDAARRLAERCGRP